MSVWTDEMKAAAMADAQKVCDQAKEIERMRIALLPFAASLRLARAAFDGPADRAHLQAVAATYIRCTDLMEAEAVLAMKEPK